MRGGRSKLILESKARDVIASVYISIYTSMPHLVVPMSWWLFLAKKEREEKAMTEPMNHEK